MRRERVGESRENMGFAEETTRVAAERTAVSSLGKIRLPSPPS
jgi:hypothetical protein